MKYRRTGPRETLGRVMTRASFLTLVNKPWHHKNTNNGKKIGGNDKRGHGLEIRKGADGKMRLWCGLCEVQIADKVSQHLGGDGHQLKYAAAHVDKVVAEVRENETTEQAYNRFLEEVLDDLHSAQRAENLSGSTKERSLKQYRLQVYHDALKANMSMGQLELFKSGE